MKKWKGVYFASMSKREFEIYKLISNSNGLTQKQIAEFLQMPPRTVRYVIKALRATKTVVASLGEDLRSPIYEVREAEAVGSGGDFDGSWQ